MGLNIPKVGNWWPRIRNRKKTFCYIPLQLLCHVIVSLIQKHQLEFRNVYNSIINDSINSNTTNIQSSFNSPRNQGMLGISREENSPPVSTRLERLQTSVRVSIHHQQIFVSKFKLSSCVATNVNQFSLDDVFIKIKFKDSLTCH